MKKDYKKILKHLYATKAAEPRIVLVPPLNYLMVSGEGRPDEEPFQWAARTLYPVAYVSKFLLKAAKPEEDFTVMPMEVKWKLDRSRHGSDRYAWTMMIMQPDCIDEALVDEAIAVLRRKKKELPYGARLRLGTYEEGLCAQILHVGPYEEPMERSFALVKASLSNQGYLSEPDSHDIYFNDVRRTAPEKLRTIIRVRVWKQNERPRTLADPFKRWAE
jgi:hypothetical protein